MLVLSSAPVIVTLSSIVSSLSLARFWLLGLRAVIQNNIGDLLKGFGRFHAVNPA